MVSGRIPGALRTRLGDDATFGLIEVLDTERKDWRDDVLAAASDRFERRLAEELSTFRGEFVQALHQLRNELRSELSTTRLDMLKWSFLFWIGQVAAIAGLLAFMLRASGR